jgi:hypothetical protein
VQSTLSGSKQVGFVPLPRVGGALSHAVASIRDSGRVCQTTRPRFSSLAGLAGAGLAGKTPGDQHAEFGRKTSYLDRTEASRKAGDNRVVLMLMNALFEEASDSDVEGSGGTQQDSQDRCERPVLRETGDDCVGTKRLMVVPDLVPVRLRK